MFKSGQNCQRSCSDCALLSIGKKSCSHRLDGVVGISQHILDRHLMLGYFKEARIRKVIHNPIEPRKEIEPKRKDEFRRNRGIVFGFAGRLSGSKGAEFLLKEFHQHQSSAKLFVYGGGGDESYGKALKDRYTSDRILFKGFRDPREMYSEIDILIVPSMWQEPFGRVIIESYGYGIPVIASNTGGISEIVQEEKTGFLFGPGDGNVLRDKITFFTENPERIPEFSSRCLQVSQKFEVRRIVHNYSETYRQRRNHKQKTHRP